MTLPLRLNQIQTQRLLINLRIILDSTFQRLKIIAFFTFQLVLYIGSFIFICSMDFGNVN